MAVTAITTKMVAGVKYTHTTADSADWASVPNDTYFYDIATEIVNYKDTNGVVIGAYAPETSTSQAQILYVDSVSGVDEATRGDLSKPFLTPEYALTQINNTATITGNTNTNTTISGISDADNATLEVGMYIVGSGVAYGTTIVSKGNEGGDLNTITISKATTSTVVGTTLTWYKAYTLVLNGSFVATGNWYKEAISYDFGSSTIAFSGRLFERLSVSNVNFKVNGGYLKGTSSSSVLYYSNSVSGTADISITLHDYYSIGTGNQLYFFGVQSFNTINIDCPNFIANLGSIAWFDTNGNIYWKGNKYGLLGGISINRGYLYSWGITQTPSSVNAFDFKSTSTGATVNDKVIGSINIFNYTAGLNFTGDMSGTTLEAQSGNGYSDSVFSGNIRYTNINVSGGSGSGSTGFAVFSGTTIGTITNNSLVNVLAFQGTYIGASSSIGIITPGRSNTIANGISGISLSGTCKLYIENSGNYDSFSGENCTGVTIGAGCEMTVTGRFFCKFIGNLAGTLNIPSNCYLGWSYSQWYTSVLTGTVNLNGGTIELFRKIGTENSTTTPAIKVSAGGKLFVDGGKIICSQAGSKSGLIWKQSDTSTVILKGQPYLKVANGLAPLQITSNTGTAQDVMNFGVVTNGAAGFRLADTFSDTTYGTAYAPNILVGGTTYEDTSYDF